MNNCVPSSGLGIILELMLLTAGGFVCEILKLELRQGLHYGAIFLSFVLKFYLLIDVECWLI